MFKRVLTHFGIEPFTRILLIRLIHGTFAEFFPVSLMGPFSRYSLLFTRTVYQTILLDAQYFTLSRLDRSKCSMVMNQVIILFKQVQRQECLAMTKIKYLSQNDMISD